ncbi:hypothetical protein [Pseudoduganella armeniaca]|uniref:DUF4440 domain-containing protein n=1 Tax=Pseudoduganella armeniaca TaxID=2072590 RepID=A0A2R4C5S1_9BURK|nr:hypothetical protein [Pseudoduganella armeniaca]AVR94977.1 hypothetical protein C9I28_04035 [Pseudoduganella armeniaca]
MKPALAFLLAAALSGCARHDNGPSDTPTISPAAARAAAMAASKDPYAPLMAAVFGDDYLPAQGRAVEGIGAPDSFQKANATIYRGATSTRLPSGETVLVVTSTATDENGDESPSLADPGRLSIYLLRQQDGRWQVTRRHDEVAQLGRMGEAGELRWVMLARNKPGLAVEHHWIGQGYVATRLSLFDPSRENITDLTGEGILIASDSSGACPQATHCWSGTATWRFEPAPGAYDELVLTISGEQDDVPEDAPASSAATGTRSLAGSARYVFERGSYRLRDGANTLPMI